MRWKRLRIWALRPLLAAALVVGCFLGWNHATSNFGTVEPGKTYRSGQMPADRLGRRIREYGIKTVLNLRGHHPESSWYRAERAAVLAEGGVQVDVALSSCEWMSRAQARTLVEILETADRPLLIHCFHGSERTGLVSAFDALLRPGADVARASEQFSLAHLYLPIGDGVVTARHLEQYLGWLKAEGRSHSPEVFKRWVLEAYRPGTPTREDWPFDPYPLQVVTRPAPRPGSPPDVRTEWTPGSEPGSPRRSAGADVSPLRR